MEIIESIASANFLTAGCVLTIGNFDGMHLGHQRIIKEAQKAAWLTGAKTLAVMTFEPHPAAILHPEMAPRILTPMGIKKRLLENLGIDCLIILKDSVDLLNLSPADFVDRFLMKHIRPKVIIEGQSFNFGYGRSGNAQTLQNLSATRSFDVVIVPAIEIKIGDSTFTCSSSIVRSFLEEGAVSKAKSVLGRAYRLVGPTVAGRGMGKQMGFPTVNIQPGEQIIPAEGVYAGLVETGDAPDDVCAPGRARPAAISIGRAKTFVSSHPLLIEAHILDDKVEDLSGRYLAMDFVARIRSQQRFETKDRLAEQIAKDCDTAKKILSG